jgi:hypothetical protein
MTDDVNGRHGAFWGASVSVTDGHHHGRNILIEDGCAPPELGQPTFSVVEGGPGVMA